MSFGKSQSRIRKGNAPSNIAIIRHADLNMIKGAKRMRKAAVWNDALTQVF